MADPKHCACRPHQQAGCRGQRGERCLKKSLAHFLNAWGFGMKISLQTGTTDRNVRGRVIPQPRLQGTPSGWGVHAYHRVGPAWASKHGSSLWHRPRPCRAGHTVGTQQHTLTGLSPAGAARGSRGSRPAAALGPRSPLCPFRTLPVHCGSRPCAAARGSQEPAVPSTRCPSTAGLRQPPCMALTFSFIPCFGGAGSLLRGSCLQLTASGRRLKGRGAQQRRAPQGQRGGPAPVPGWPPPSRTGSAQPGAGGPGWRARERTDVLPPETRSDEDWALGPWRVRPEQQSRDATRPAHVPGSGLIALLPLSLWPLSRTPLTLCFSGAALRKEGL